MNTDEEIFEAVRAFQSGVFTAEAVATLLASAGTGTGYSRNAPGIYEKHRSGTVRRNVCLIHTIVGGVCMIHTMTSADLCKLLEKAGWVLVRTRGSHRQYRKDGRLVTVPHPRKELGIGLVKAIRKQAGL